MNNKEKVLFLLGPTGVGKSDLAIEIAKKYDMEIISADSVQVFKEFDIGIRRLKSNVICDFGNRITTMHQVVKRQSNSFSFLILYGAITHIRFELTH